MQKWQGTRLASDHGRLAQLVEHLVYTERVGSSSLSSPTMVGNALRKGNAVRQKFTRPVSFSYWSGCARHHTRMSSQYVLTVILGAALPLLPVTFVNLDRNVPAQEECVGKKRVATVPARAKKEASRKRCRVIAPILM